MIYSTKDADCGCLHGCTEADTPSQPRACGHKVNTRRNLVVVFVVSKGVCSITPSKPNMERQITHGFSNAFHWTLFVHKV